MDWQTISFWYYIHIDVCSIFWLIRGIDLKQEKQSVITTMVLYIFLSICFLVVFYVCRCGNQKKSITKKLIWLFLVSSPQKWKKQLIPSLHPSILYFISFILSLSISSLYVWYNWTMLSRVSFLKCWDAWTNKNPKNKKKNIFQKKSKKKKYRMGKGNDSAFRMNASSRELAVKPIRPRKRPTTALQLHLVG